MPRFKDLDIDKLFDEADKSSNTFFAQGLAQFRNILNEQTVVRLFVDGTPGYGHQAASVLLLRTLVGEPNGPYRGFDFNTGKTVEICYRVWKDADSPLPKIQRLLSEVNWQLPTPTLNGATLRVRRYPLENPAQRRFAFTAGADDFQSGDAESRLRQGLGVIHFLRLQPYRWLEPHQVQSRSKDGEERVRDLVDFFVSKGDYLPIHAYFMPTPVMDDWGRYTGSADPDVKRKAEILQWLTTDEQLREFDLGALYSFHYGFGGDDDPVVTANRDEVFDALLNFLCSILVMQGKRTTSKKPAVIVNFDKIGFMNDESDGQSYIEYPSFKYLHSILAGNLTRIETAQVRGIKLLDDAKRQRGGFYIDLTSRLRRRERYFNKLVEVTKHGQLSRLRFQNAQDLLTLKAFMLHWFIERKDRVFFLQLGSVPPEVFGYVLSRCTLPPVFEGYNTANLALNIGEGFLQLMRPTLKKSDDTYPSIPAGARAGKEQQELKRHANLINEPLSSWPTKERDYFPNRVGNFLAEYMKQRDAGKGNLITYFRKVRQYYQNSRHDKLRMGLNYLGFVLAGKVEEPLTGAPGAEPDRLDEIMADIRKQIDATGEVALLPGLFGPLGEIDTFYRDLLTDPPRTLVVRGAAVAREPEEGDIAAVRLTGRTDAFADDMETAVAFTAEEEDQISVSATYTSKEDAWSPHGLPWVRLGDPFLHLDVSEGGLPVAGALGGTVDLGGEFRLKLSLAVPVVDGLWLLRGTVSDNVGLAQIYGLFGGVNLLSVFPQEIATLGGLHLTAIEGLFDSKANSLGLQYFMADAETTDELKLFGNLSLAKVGLRVLVESPADSATLSGTVTGEFRIGKEGDEEPAIIAVSAGAPELYFRGALTSGVIRIEDLIALFIPGVDLELPHEAPVIDAFRFAYDRTGGAWEVGCDLRMPAWLIEVGGTPIFQIENVGLLLSDRLTSISGSLTLFPGEDFALDLLLVATRSEETGWWFEAHQTAGTLPLGKLAERYLGWKEAPDIEIAGLGLAIETRTGSYAFTARTAEDFKIPFLGPDSSVGAAVELRYIGGDEARHAGRVEAHLTWRSIALIASYAFDGDKTSWIIAWGGQTAVYDDQTKVATFALSGLTVGDLVAMFVSWATGSRFGLTAPWNVLDEISLDGLVLSFNFETRNVRLTKPLDPPLDLGFLAITELTLTYGPHLETNKDKAVLVSLKGRFPWKEENADALGWDATEPEKAPAPPGGGNRFIDLRVLALGQHVTIAGVEDQTSVEEVIAAIRKQAVPSGDDIPVGSTPEPGQPYFNPDSSWLIAADFGLLKSEKKENGERREIVTLDDGSQVIPPATAARGDDEAPTYAIQMSVIFNDPVLYGLRLSLDGDAAKILKGLVFEVMYRRVSDSVGVYRTELTLPEQMREMTIGAYSVTLPVLALEVYTNGDFQVDLGFPWNLMFARSFTIEGIVPPGIPMIGSGGFYFGKLSAETSDHLPVPTVPGRFQPVIVFGFGLQVGVGKNFNKGPLRAGFSITMLGILEGTIAKWNPQNPLEGGAKNQLQGEYYFKLAGTVGIIGKLYGSVDLAVIKADVHVELKVYAQITVESYADIPLTVVAMIDIAIAIMLNFGIFRIRIDLSFSAQIKETFLIQNPEGAKVPPWGRQDRSLQARHQQFLTHARRRLAGMGEPQPAVLSWDNYQVTKDPEALKGYLMPMLSAARTGDGESARACYVAMLLLETVAPPARAIGPRTDELKSFQKLCEDILRWTIAAALDEPHDEAWIEGYAVPKDLLEAIMLALSDRQNPMPISAEAASRYMTRRWRLQVSIPRGEGADDTTVFPMPPELTLDVPAYGGFPALHYRFGEFNELADDYIATLRDYFDQLAVQVEEELDPDAATPRAAAPPPLAGKSMATFCFADYFLLLARQMVQGALDALRSYDYPIPQGRSVLYIVAWINQMSTTENAIADPSRRKFTAEQLFQANAGHPLTAGKELLIEGLTYQIANDDTLERIVKAPYGERISVTALAQQNGQKTGILMVGAEVTFGERVHTIEPGDTLTSVADAFGVTLAELIKGSDLATTAGLLKPLAVLDLPPLRHPTAEGNADTPEGIATSYGAKVELLAKTASNLEIADLFATRRDEEEDEDLRYLSIPHLEQFRVSGLLHQIRRSNGVQHLSGMAARYALHGLRLPTDGIDCKHPSMCDQDGELQDVCGLYALTGQQFPIPPLVDGEAFSFALSKGDGPDWVRFYGAANATELRFEVDPVEASRVVAVHEAAAGIIPKLSHLGALGASESRPATFPLRSMIRWQCPEQVPLPYGTGASERQELRVWWLPGGISALAEQVADEGAGPPLPPRFSVQIGTYDDATARMSQRSSAAYDFGTLVDLHVKKISARSGSPATDFTYELTGVGENEIVLLERLLRSFGSAQPPTLDGLTVLYPPSATSDAGAGLCSAGDSIVTTFLSQVNLSTYTKPPAAATRTAAGGEEWREDFVKRLWRGGITRSGGFYLYYDEDGKEGLPDHVFNDKGEATIWLLLRCGAPAEAAHQSRPADYMNCAITGDAIEVSEDSAAVVFMEAAPLASTWTPAAADSLRSIACAHYMTAIDVAGQNADHPLVEAVPVWIVGGTYMVSPLASAPGGGLEVIADYFGTSVEKIKNANPDRTSWPDALSAYEAIRLPRIRTTVGRPVRIDGKVYVNGNTLGELAAYHGCSVADLAHANAEAKSLLAGSQDLQLSGGPTIRAASVPVGTVSLGAARIVPKDIPGDPADPEFGPLYLQHMFTMLGYRVFPNLDFEQSNQGLPMGPIETREHGGEPRRIREALPVRREGETWAYRTSIPSARLALQPAFVAGEGLPDPAQSPYAGIGGLIQVDFGWQDIFGNEGRTPLADPALDPDAPLNRRPVLFGYTDQLIGLAAWPGVTAAYHVPRKMRKLAIVLHFDTSRYEPSDDRLMALSGEPDDDLPAWKRNAQLDLKVYTRLYYQLLQAVGGGGDKVMLSLETSLFAEPVVPFSAVQMEALRGWVGRIWRYLASRAAADERTPSFPGDHDLHFPIEGGTAGASLNPAEIFALTVGIRMRRPEAALQSGLRSTPEVFDVRTEISPVLLKDEAGRPSFKASAKLTHGLRQFADDFEESLSDPKRQLLKIATGVARERLSPAGSRMAIWVVRVGLRRGEAISYVVRNPGEPLIFAPRPISTRAESRQDVPIWPYKSGEVMNFDGDPPLGVSFGDVDMDLWGRTFVEAVDYVLSPDFVTPARLVARKCGDADYLEPLLRAKDSLADSFSALVAPVFLQDRITTSEMEAAHETFKQRLLVRLSDLYASTAIVQFKVDIDADLTGQEEGKVAPRLYGTPLPKEAQEETGVQTSISLSSAKLSLNRTSPAEPALLTFVAESEDRARGAAESYVLLDLEFQGLNIEHEIEPGFDRYEASSWLSFVVPLAPRERFGVPWRVDLGPFTLPLPLRALPTPPSMMAQTGKASIKAVRERDVDGGDAASLQSLLLWDYAFTYAQDYHEPQDEIHFAVEFSIKPQTSFGLDTDPLFEALAQFVTTYPDVQRDLEKTLRGVDASTADEETLKVARAAFLSLTRLVERVAGATAPGTGGMVPFRSTEGIGGAEPYCFTSVETSKTMDDLDNPALLVGLTGKPPEGVGDPFLEIPGYETERVEESHDYGFVFFASKDGKKSYLTAAEGRRIPERILTLPALDILARQDAWASAQLFRNDRTLDPNRRATNADFIYETPKVRFANPLYPTLEVSESIDISAIGANGKEPIRRSLAAHLAALFSALFEKTLVPDCTLQIECRYDYAVNPALSAVSLPVFFRPPRPFDIARDAIVPDDGCPSDPDVPVPAVCTLAAAVHDWASAHRPNLADGVLRFDITIFSHLSDTPKPLLRLPGPYVEVHHLDPPLCD